MLPIKLVVKTLKVLGSNASPSQIAGGFVLGVFLGLAPLFCGHNLVVIALLFLLNVNLSATLLAWLLFRFIRLFLDPLTDSLGFSLLNTDALEGFWTFLYNTPPFATSGFNNTIVLGGLVLSLLLAAPLYFGAKRFIPYYREHLQDRVNNWKIIRWLKMSKLYNWYRRFAD